MGRGPRIYLHSTHLVWMWRWRSPVSQTHTDFPARHCATWFQCWVLLNPYNNPMRYILSWSFSRVGSWDLENFCPLIVTPELRSGIELDDTLNLSGNMCWSGFMLDFYARCYFVLTVAGKKWLIKTWLYQKVKSHSFKGFFSFFFCMFVFIFYRRKSHLTQSVIKFNPGSSSPCHLGWIDIVTGVNWGNGNPLIWLVCIHIPVKLYHSAFLWYGNFCSQIVSGVQDGHTGTRAHLLGHTAF